MSAMKSLYFARPDTMEVWQVDEPTPGPGEVKVKTAYASICATDIHQVTQGAIASSASKTNEAHHNPRCSRGLKPPVSRRLRAM